MTEKKKLGYLELEKNNIPFMWGMVASSHFSLQRNVLNMSLPPIGSVYIANTMRSDWSNIPDRNYFNYFWPLATAWGDVDVVRRRASFGPLAVC